MIIDDDTRCTLRAREIMHFLATTKGEDGDIELSALINVLTLGYLRVEDIPRTQKMVDKLSDMITEAINKFAVEHVVNALLQPKRSTNGS